MKDLNYFLVLSGMLIHGVGCGSSYETPLGKLPGGQAIPEAPSVPKEEIENRRITGGIQIVSQTRITAASVLPAWGNLVFDGLRLVVPDGAGGFPMRSPFSFAYISPALSFQGYSLTSIEGASAWSLSLSPGPVIGQVALFWNSSPYATTGTVIVRRSEDGGVVSQFPVDFKDYGCRREERYHFTSCGSEYYGACTSESGYLRLFSFGPTGALRSAVTTSQPDHEYVRVAGITCHAGKSLILVTGASDRNAFFGFYKYSLNFSLLRTDSARSDDFPEDFLRITGVASDGSYLYLQGKSDGINMPLDQYPLGKATLGDLED